MSRHIKKNTAGTGRSRSEPTSWKTHSMQKKRKYHEITSTIKGRYEESHQKYADYNVARLHRPEFKMRQDLIYFKSVFKIIF